MRTRVVCAADPGERASMIHGEGAKFLGVTCQRVYIVYMHVHVVCVRHSLCDPSVGGNNQDGGHV